MTTTPQAALLSDALEKMGDFFHAHEAWQLCRIDDGRIQLHLTDDQYEAVRLAVADKLKPRSSTLTNDELIDLAVEHGLGRTLPPLGLNTGNVFYTDNSYRTAALFDFADAHEAAILAKLQATQEPVQSVPEAMKVVTEALRSDPDYAWSWHCNVAMASVDEGMGHYEANQAAARFMHSLAGVDTTKHQGFPPAPEQEPVQAGELPDERAAFEQWASDNGEFPRAVARSGDVYHLMATQTYWLAWQARATLSSRKPLTDEQIEPMFKARNSIQAEGTKDAWYWYAWGVSDGEQAHGMGGQHANKA